MIERKVIKFIDKMLIYKLHFIENWKPKDIASHTGFGVTTIRKYLRIAKKEDMKCLGKEDKIYKKKAITEEVLDFVNGI